MASVTLDKVWLHEADDLDEYVTIRFRGVQAATDRQVDQRVYAAGRVRTITRPAKVSQVSFVAVKVPQATLEWVDDRLGQELMYRDPYGRVWWGVIASLPVDEELTVRPDVTLTLRAVTGSAEV